MLQYTVTQWVFIFYFYCFFGWCFESTYVSIKTRKLTNRGFMHGPFLPLYGSGAIMMLVVSLPFRGNVPLTYLAGCVGATILEYVTGVVMEKMFRVRYWDYSKQRFQFQGHICLRSTIAWGGLTILMTEVVHVHVENIVLSIQTQVLSAVTFVLTAWIFADFALSFKAALDLRDVLLKLEEAKIELGHLQMRMDAFATMTAEEFERRLQEYKDGVKQRKESIAGALTQKKEELETFLAGLMAEAESITPDPGKVRERLQEAFAAKKAEMLRRRQEIYGGMERQIRKILRANPSFGSKEYPESVEELQRDLVEKEGK